jgi:hypothetical protein
MFPCTITTYSWFLTYFLDPTVRNLYPLFHDPSSFLWFVSSLKKQKGIKRDFVFFFFTNKGWECSDFKSCWPLWLIENTGKWWFLGFPVTFSEKLTMSCMTWRLDMCLLIHISPPLATLSHLPTPKSWETWHSSSCSPPSHLSPYSWNSDITCVYFIWRCRTTPVHSCRENDWIFYSQRMSSIELGCSILAVTQCDLDMIQISKGD